MRRVLTVWLALYLILGSIAVDVETAPAPRIAVTLTSPVEGSVFAEPATVFLEAVVTAKACKVP